MKRGLSYAEAKKRLRQYGKNEIEKTKKVNPLKILLSQFSSPLILILVLAALVLGVVSIVSHESSTIDIVLIGIIVIASGLSGFFQDYKAEKSIEALQEMATPSARVIREGKEFIIPSSEVVVGDIVVLSSGDVICADATLIEGTRVKTDESILTGESEALGKKVGEELYMNTYITSGNALARVEKTGMRTRVGEIAKKLEHIEEDKSPFYKEVEALGKKLFWGVIVVAVLTALIGLTKYSAAESILSAIALAVAAIPEGLPAVLVLSLAIGAKVMAKKKALIRKLGVVESMGSVNVICTDKTGTLTKDEMEVIKMFSDEKEILKKDVDSKTQEKLLTCCAFNNDVHLVENKGRDLIGDETEIAIYTLAKEKGFDKDALSKTHKRIHEIPFDSKRKMMSVVIEERKRTVYTKGAPELVLEKCDHIFVNGKVRKITKKDKAFILNKNEEFASETLRVLGFAYKEINKIEEKEIEKNLIWIGLIGIMDPPRAGVEGAIAECKQAGIRAIMLTGDNPITAKAIAQKIGIVSTGVIVGGELEKMNESQLLKKLKEGVNIFARLNPVHKLEIMTLLKKHGDVVAMTGDGVNDALALKKADVGIAMGIRGTAVSKQASDLILLDDNFVTIVGAIKEGRRVFSNIRKFVNYLLTSNFSEVAIIFLATLFLALENPILLPVQLLWINLLTDGFPALTLGMDPAKPGIMKDPPRKKSEHVINKTLAWIIVSVGLIITGLLFVLFFVSDSLYGAEVARTTLFSGLVLFEFARIGAIRSQEHLNWFSNKWLLVALSVSILLQLLIIYTPLNSLFKIVPLGIGSWGLLVFGSIVAYALAIVATKIVMKKVKD